MNIGDNELLEMLRSEETRDDGFRMLMQKFGRAIYWNIRRIVVGHDDAEDVMQETCVRILENISRFDGDCQLSTWIYRIAHNDTIDYHI